MNSYLHHDVYFSHRHDSMKVILHKPIIPVIHILIYIFVQCQHLRGMFRSQSLPARDSPGKNAEAMADDDVLVDSETKRWLFSNELVGSFNGDGEHTNGDFGNSDDLGGVESQMGGMESQMGGMGSKMSEGLMGENLMGEESKLISESKLTSESKSSSSASSSASAYSFSKQALTHKTTNMNHNAGSKSTNEPSSASASKSSASASASASKATNNNFYNTGGFRSGTSSGTLKFILLLSETIRNSN
jgi:hypothetical protein